MKKMLILLLMGVTTICQSQDKVSTISKGEEFSAQAGKLIEKQFLSIGKLKGLRIDVVKFKDLVSGATASTLRFEYDVKKTYTTDTKRASIDADEIEGLIKSLKILKSDVLTTSRDIYTEVIFKSRTGFQAGAYWDLKTSSWKGFIQVEPYSSDSFISMSTNELEELQGYIESAVSKM
jgi:hypothetical protein